VQIFADGRLALEVQRSISEGDHWLVAGITVADGRISLVEADRIERQQGQCLSPAPTGTACTVDTACAANEFCNTGTGRCAVGCRSDASCAANQTCNADRVCVADAGTGGYNDPCSATTDCRNGLTCNALLGSCTEPCTTGSSCSLCTTATGTPCSCLEFIPGTGFCLGGAG
jgi:hypothetical protein